MFQFLTVLPDALQPGDLIDDQVLLDVYPHGFYEDTYALSFTNGDAWNARADIPLTVIRSLTSDQERQLASLIAAN